MGITTSYNRRNGVRYAYDTTYEMDEAAGKKVQRRRCIGHVDPETGEIVPNGGRGRPRVADEAPARREREPPRDPAAAGPSDERLSGMEAACMAVVRSCEDLSRQAQALARELRLMREA